MGHWTKATLPCKYSAYRGRSEQFIYLEGNDREGFSCGEWWMRGGPTDAFKSDNNVGEGEWTLLTHGFVWHQD